MGLETVIYIDDLNVLWPLSLIDPANEGDDHIRNLKSAILATFPGLTGAVTATHAELNILDGVTSSAADLNLLSGGAATARTNLGLEIGTDVQAYDAQLADVAGLAVTDGNIIVGDGTNFVAESGATARTSLGFTAPILDHTVSTAAASGGSAGDIWFKYVA